MNAGESRLDRMERLLADTLQGLAETRKIVDSNARAIQANSDAIQANRGAIADLRVSMEQQNQELRDQASETVEWFSGVVNQADEDRALILEMQSEVRGLQVENRRILERIDRHFSDGHGAA
jgi:hypothetical protein